MAKSLPEDSSLWLKFIEGNDDAFSTLYNHYTNVLYAYGKRYLADEEQLLDCIQELFIDIYRCRKTLARNVGVKFYLFCSLKHKIAKANREKHTDENCIGSHEYQNSDQFIINFNAEDILIRDEEYATYLKVLIEEINKLPAKQKEILYLRFNSEMDYEEIASLLQISVASCRTLVYRGIKTLRQHLEKSVSKNLLFLLSIII